MDTQEKILQSALKLFVRDGFGATTTAITQDAGVSTGILFHYFPTKNDLIISLYSDFYHDYLQGTYQLKKAINVVDPDEYQEIHKQAFFDGVNWSLDNWEKFQFIQLFDGSILVNKFKIEEEKRYHDMFAEILNVLQIAVDRGIFKPLPTVFIINNLYAITNSVVKYIHDNPQYRHDQAFMDQAWLVYWETAALH